MNKRLRKPIASPTPKTEETPQSRQAIEGVSKGIQGQPTKAIGDFFKLEITDYFSRHSPSPKGGLVA